MYDENGTGPVRRFQSEDPEGRGVYWDVTGIDADDFEINTAGVLTFKKSPNYDEPTDRARAEDTSVTPTIPAIIGGDNMYQITVRASEMRNPGETRLALSTEAHITVQVMNVQEFGKVELYWLHPEVTTPITASLSDPDGGITNPTWCGTFPR